MMGLANGVGEIALNGYSVANNYAVQSKRRVWSKWDIF